MIFSEKMKVVVLGGGTSSERQVSLVTSVNVCIALRKLGYKAILVDSYLGFDDIYGNIDSLFENENLEYKNFQIEINAPIINGEINKKSKFGPNVLEICKSADCVFIGLHGEDGEDGKIQGALDLLGIPYTGSGSVGSAMAMDKSITRMVMQFNNINCAPITQGPPCVIKCKHGGSSLGTYICETSKDYSIAMTDIQKYNDEFIIEKKINGREFTVPILGDKVLTPIEIIPPENGKFDYVAKYQTGKNGAKEICPAPLELDKIKEIQELAFKLHKALNLSVYSRTDFMMDNEGVFYCLEINTLPGLTPNSLLPKAAKYEGIEYPQLCEKIINLSLDKY